eukprot:1195001-Prorocentrum_minimum.AAC.9
MTHYIKRLAFGEGFPGAVNPLDGAPGPPHPPRANHNNTAARVPVRLDVIQVVGHATLSLSRRAAGGGRQ